MGLLTNDLNVLQLHLNSLQGTIPTEMGMLNGLLELTLSNNALVGSIPSELGLLTNMYMFYVSDNPELGGTLPMELNTNLAALQVFDVGNTSVLLPDGGLPSPLKEIAQNLTFERFFHVCKQLYPCED